MIAFLAKKISAAEGDERELEKQLWTGAKWIYKSVVAGKTTTTLEGVAAELVPRAVSAGLPEEKARRQLERGWTPDRPKAAAAAPTMRTAAAPASRRDELLLLLNDPLVKAALGRLIFDAVGAALISSTKRGVA